MKAITKTICWLYLFTSFFASLFM